MSDYHIIQEDDNCYAVMYHTSYLKRKGLTRFFVSRASARKAIWREKRKNEERQEAAVRVGR